MAAYHPAGMARGQHAMAEHARVIQLCHGQRSHRSGAHLPPLMCGLTALDRTIWTRAARLPAG
jgi:hypothetical protein